MPKKNSQLSKKKKSFDSKVILQIKDTALTRYEGKSSITILNLENYEIYRVEGISAYLFERISGVDTLEKIISTAAKNLKVSGPQLQKFHSLVMSFYQEIYLANLVMVLKSPMSSAQLSTPKQTTKINFDWKQLKNNNNLEKLSPNHLAAGSASSGGCCAGSGGSAGTIGGAGTSGTSGSYGTMSGN